MAMLLMVQVDKGIEDYEIVEVKRIIVDDRADICVEHTLKFKISGISYPFNWWGGRFKGLSGTSIAIRIQ